MNDLYFDDIVEGFRFETGGRTITEADIVNFAGVSGDFHKLHMDAQYAERHTPHGERIAHGMLVVSITTGLIGRSDFMRAIETSTLGVKELRCAFKKPVFIGDTIRVSAEIIGRSESKAGNRGTIQMLRKVLNQHDETVVELSWFATLLKR